MVSGSSACPIRVHRCCPALPCTACGADTTALNPAVAGGNTVSMSGGAVALIARDSLTLANSGSFACCALDSAVLHMQVTAGTLNLFAVSIYAETMFTPASSKPKACVQPIPNGSILVLNDVPRHKFVTYFTTSKPAVAGARRLTREGACGTGLTRCFGPHWELPAPSG
jgi:hypothetical protein